VPGGLASGESEAARVARAACLVASGPACLPCLHHHGRHPATPSG